MKTMWHKGALLVVFVLVNCLVFSQNVPGITWSETFKLSWNDFKDQPDPDTDVVAITASGLTFHYAIQKENDEIIGFSTEVKTSFYPEKSWVKSERANAHILSHEQLHFDITELHTRKFRQQLSKLKVSKNLVETLDSIHYQIQTDLKLMQNVYDMETDFSRDIKAQAHWEQLVQEELLKLSGFKS